MIRPAFLILALTTSMPCFAGGFGGDAPPTRIPVTAQNVSGVIEDRGGVVVTLKRISWNGEIFVGGELGAGSASVPFERVKTIEVLDSPTKHQRTARVTLDEGTTVELLVDDDLEIFGEATWGLFRIEAKDVLKITLTGVTPR